MTGIQVGFVIFGVMLALMVIRVPIGISMFSVGALGYLYLTGGSTAATLSTLKNLAYAPLSNYDLVVVPLFVAAVLPGIIAMLGYMLIVRIYVTIRPGAGPAGPRVAWPDRIRALLQVTPVLFVFIVVIVGIYGGWANPTEAAAIGAAA